MTKALHGPLLDVYVEPKASGLEAIANQVADIVLEHEVCVVRNFATAIDARKARAATRNLLAPSTPLRALRVGAEHVLGRERTPDFLQRRPVTLPESRWQRFGSTTFALLNETQLLNETLAATAAITEAYGSEVHRLNSAILNRFASHEEFEVHQDSTANVGLSYVLQTSPTLWHIHEGGPRAGKEPFRFFTDAGDLVVQTQRKGEMDPSKTHRHTGFDDFQLDGSAVHSALNLTSKNRFTIQQFSDQTKP